MGDDLWFADRTCERVLPRVELPNLARQANHSGVAGDRKRSGDGRSIQCDRLGTCMSQASRRPRLNGPEDAVPERVSSYSHIVQLRPEP